MDDVTIRAMHWTDIERVHAIEVDLFPVDPWTTEMFWSELAGVPESREVIVAVEDAQVVGYASLRFVDREADINTIAVSANCQSRGIGRTMYRYLESQALIHGVRDIYLDVRSDNAIAQTFYQSEGYESIDCRKNYYGSDIDAIVMRKRLDS